MLIGGIFFMMIKVVNTTVLKTTLFVNFIPLQPLGLFITTLLVLQRRQQQLVMVVTVVWKLKYLISSKMEN